MKEGFGEENDIEKMMEPLGWFGRKTRWVVLLFPRGRGVWEATQNYDMEWPHGWKVTDSRMYTDGNFCMSAHLQKEWVRENHKYLGHMGSERLWKILENRVQWANQSSAQKFAETVSKQCVSRTKYDPIFQPPSRPTSWQVLQLMFLQCHKSLPKGKRIIAW